MVAWSQVVPYPSLGRIAGGSYPEAAQRGRGLGRMGPWLYRSYAVAGKPYFPSLGHLVEIHTGFLM